MAWVWRAKRGDLAAYTNADWGRNRAVNEPWQIRVPEQADSRI